MKTAEQQEKNLHNARAYAAYEVTQAIQATTVKQTRKR